MNLYLAFDGGGTGTRAGLYDAQRTLLGEAAGPASSPALIGADASVAVLAALGRQLLSQHEGSLAGVAGAISGVRAVEADTALASALGDELGSPKTIMLNDLRPILLANAGTGAGVLAIAGTGSSVCAQDAEGGWRTIGGAGVPFGDEGSAFQIGASAMRAAAHAVDGMAPPTALVDALPQAAGVPDFTRFVRWVQAATKLDIAAFARCVGEMADAGDAVAARCIEKQAQRLVAQTLAGADALGLADDVPVFLNGGLFESCPRYCRAYEAALAETRLTSSPHLAPLRGHRAAVELLLADTLPAGFNVVAGGGGAEGTLVPPTEQSQPDAPSLDSLSALDIVRVMNREDERIAAAVAREAEPIAEVIDAAARALTSGGRIIYLGAGTSGRLGVLDASECPPTFGVDLSRVIGLIAGGEKALRVSIEGAEDDREQGAQDLAALDPPVSSKDVVVGIAASGTTPYVHGGLDFAHERGAATALVCCNPACRREQGPVIALSTGPEALPGSTRLKAGTATKQVLNMITTGAMARSGFIFEGQMVGMRPINAKLWKRAARIVAGLTDKDEGEAAALLRDTEGNIPAAVLMARRGLGAAEALERLGRAGGNLRIALGGAADGSLGRARTLREG